MYHFLDLFYFSIVPVIILFHLIFILNLVLIFFVAIFFMFLILDDWESYFMIFFMFILYRVIVISWHKSQVLKINLIWLRVFLGAFLNWIFFSVSSFDIRSLGFELRESFHFPFYWIIPISYRGSSLVKLTQVFFMLF